MSLMFKSKPLKGILIEFHKYHGAKKELKINIFFCCIAARVYITLNIKVCIDARVLHTNKGNQTSKRIFCRLIRKAEPKLSVKLLCVQFVFHFLSVYCVFYSEDSMVPIRSSNSCTKSLLINL